jgi:hypothetical protein
MELLTQIAAALAADPEIQELIVDLILAGLAACGVSGVWVIKIRAWIQRAVPLLVVKIIALDVDLRANQIKKKSRALSYEYINVDADLVMHKVIAKAANLLPASARALPVISGLVSGYVGAEAKRTLERIQDGGPPLRSVGSITRAGMRGFAELRADAQTIMGDGGFSFGQYGLGGDNETLRVGANVSYDWRSGKVDWGANLKIMF